MKKHKHFEFIRMGALPSLPPLSWWIPRLLPRGCLVLVEGAEGVGKGYFACWCLVQMASGAWGPPMAGAYLSSEEEPEVIQARLLAAGYDPDRHAPIVVLRVNGGDDLLQLPEDLAALRGIVRQYRLGMVVVDVLRDHSAPTEDMGILQRSNNDETWIRPAAGAWGRLAAQTGATVLGLHHRNKSELGSSRSKSTGSGGWRQRARHVVVLAKVRDERALAVDKRNFGREDPTVYAFEIEEVTPDFGRFALGDPVASYRNIDHWEAEMRKGPKLEMDPAGVLQAWCLTQLGQGKGNEEDRKSVV